MSMVGYFNLAASLVVLVLQCLNLYRSVALYRLVDQTSKLRRLEIAALSQRINLLEAERLAFRGAFFQ